MLVMFYRYTKKPIWCFRGNPFDVLGVSGVVRCNCHNLNRSWRFFNITSMTLIRHWVMRRLIWVWNDFLFHWHDAAEVDGRRLLYINVLSNKLTHNIHVSKTVRADLGTSWLGYELTKKGTSWLGYELTRNHRSSWSIAILSFQDILLTSIKCPNLQRAINPVKIDRIRSKVNQVIYSSSPISWPSFKPLAQFEMPKFATGHNSKEIWRNLFKT